MSSSEPKSISVPRRPMRSTNPPAKGAKTIEAKMMIEEVPGAVENMCRKLPKTPLQKLPPVSAVSASPHFSWKKSVERAVKGKIAE